MIQPFQKDDAFLADVAAPPGSADELKLWWLGQSGFLVRCEEAVLLLDPYLSDSLTAKYEHTDKPHVRLTERVIAPERLTGIRVVTSSHNHTDHLDAETLVPLLRANPQLQLVIPEANREFVAHRLGIEPQRPIGLDEGRTVTAGGFTFHGVAAAHDALDCDALGRHLYLGYVVRCGPWTLYHSGDTRWYEGLAGKLRALEIDVALLPINGHRPERRVAGNLGGREAAQLAFDIGARWAVPCHYEMFAFNTASPDEFVAECERLGQAHRVLRAGEGLALGEAGNGEAGNGEAATPNAQRSTPNAQRPTPNAEAQAGRQTEAALPASPFRCLTASKLQLGRWALGVGRWALLLQPHVLLPFNRRGRLA